MFGQYRGPATARHGVAVVGSVRADTAGLCAADCTARRTPPAACTSFTYSAATKACALYSAEAVHTAETQQGHQSDVYYRDRSCAIRMGTVYSTPPLGGVPRASSNTADEPRQLRPGRKQKGASAPAIKRPMTWEPNGCAPTPHMPPGVAGLCTLTHASAWQQLRVFFSNAEPKLRLYVADVHGQAVGRHGGMTNTLCTKHVKQCLAAFGDREAMAGRVGAYAYCREFGAEQMLPASVAASRFATDSPAQADIILANACVMGNGMQGQHQPVIAKRLKGKPANV